MARAERIGLVRGRMMLPVDAEVAAAVDFGGVVELAGDAVDELAAEEDAEGGEDAGHPDAPEAVEQV